MSVSPLKRGGQPCPLKAAAQARLAEWRAENPGKSAPTSIAIYTDRKGVERYASDGKAVAAVKAKVRAWQARQELPEPAPEAAVERSRVEVLIWGEWLAYDVPDGRRGLSAYSGASRSADCYFCDAPTPNGAAPRFVISPAVGGPRAGVNIVGACPACDAAWCAGKPSREALRRHLITEGQVREWLRGYYAGEDPEDHLAHPLNWTLPFKNVMAKLEGYLCRSEPWPWPSL